MESCKLIPSTGNLIYKWDLKRIKLNGAVICIQYGTRLSYKKFYKITLFEHCAHSQQQRFKDGDIISLYFNLPESTLEFKVNDGIRVIACRFIPESADVQWSFVACVYDIGDSFEIVDFSKHDITEKYSIK